RIIAARQRRRSYKERVVRGEASRGRIAERSRPEHFPIKSPRIQGWRNSSGIPWGRRGRRIVRSPTKGRRRFVQGFAQKDLELGQQIDQFCAGRFDQLPQV